MLRKRIICFTGKFYISKCKMFNCSLTKICKTYLLFKETFSADDNTSSFTMLSFLVHLEVKDCSWCCIAIYITQYPSEQVGYRYLTDSCTFYMTRCQPNLNPDPAIHHSPLIIKYSNMTSLFPFAKKNQNYFFVLSH